MFDGFAAAQTMPELADMTLDRLCNFVYWYLVRDGDPDAVDKFRARLWRPPFGVVADPRSPWSAENEMSGFAAAKAALGGGL